MEIVNSHSYQVLLIVFYTTALALTSGTHWDIRCPTHCVCNIRQSMWLSRNLKTVDCRYANLSKIPNDMPTDVEVMILKGNRLNAVHTRLPLYTSLQEIDMSENQITTLGIHPMFENLTSLRYLNLDKNEIRVLRHGSFSGLKNLDNLILSKNRVSTIEEHSFGGLNHLQRLDLSGNKLDHLKHEWFESVSHLQELFLDQNGITSITDGVFESLKLLSTLSLSKNSLRRISVSNFRGLENLQSLFLDYANLDSIPTAVLQIFRDLRILSLSGNNFLRIGRMHFSRLTIRELIISNLPNLELVDAQAFYDLPHLRILQMNDNPKLMFIDPDAFEDVPILTKLYVHNNHLYTLPATLSALVPSLNEITFYGNPILCDCNVLWIRKLMDRNNTQNVSITFAQSDKYVCEVPHQKRLRSISISSIPKTCRPTVLSFLQQSASTEVGNTFRMDCRGIGVPKPYIYWILPMGKILNGTSNEIRYQLLNTGSLVLDPVKLEDSGTYRCAAGNKLEQSDTSSLQLQVHQKNIHVLPQGVGTDFITVTWNGTDNIMSSNDYHILYRINGSNDIYQNIQLRPSMKSYTITNLKSDKNYEFCIAYEHYIEILQINCIVIKTRQASFEKNGISKIYESSTVIALSVTLSLIVVLCLVIFIVKRLRRRKYKEPRGVSYHVGSMSQIPLDNLYNPPSTPLISSSKQSLLS